MRDTIDMAREVWGDDSDKPWSESALLHIKAFEALVRADERSGCAAQYLRIMRNAVVDAVEIEREACAKVCEGLEHKLRNTSYTPNGFSCATAIRARGNT